jgi:hypothetical protein
MVGARTCWGIILVGGKTQAFHLRCFSELPVRIKVLFVRCDPIHGYLALRGQQIELSITDHLTQAVFQGTFHGSIPNGRRIRVRRVSNEKARRCFRSAMPSESALHDERQKLGFRAIFNTIRSVASVPPTLFSAHRG